MGTAPPAATKKSPQVVTIELFGGILPATAALKKCGVSFLSFCSEIASDPIELASAHWPEAIPIGDMRDLDLAWFDKVVKDNPDSLIWVTGGIPCKDVSTLNANRQGATGRHSGLFEVAAKILNHLKGITQRMAFTFECTRMDEADRVRFSKAFGTQPIEINNRGWSPLSRPRWWWIGGMAPVWPNGTQHGLFQGVKRVRPQEQPNTWQKCILPGYTPCSVINGESEVCFRCLTTRTPKDAQPDDAVGLAKASLEARQRWKEDKWSQAPYQYEAENMVQDASGIKRRLLPCEEEQLMGYPPDYTAALKKTPGENHRAHAYRRQTLLGNSWSLHVTVFLVQALILPHVSSHDLTGDSCFEHIDAEAFKWGRENCPYLHDLEKRQLDTSQSLPPDWSEMNSYSSGSLADGVQLRKHTPWHLAKGTFGHGPVASLPKGLPPTVHFKAGSLADSPVDKESEVPDDLDFAIRKTIALGSKADAWRRQQTNALISWLKHSHNLKDMWENLRSENSVEVAPKVEPHGLDLLGHSIKWPDVSVPAMMAVGARPLGRQEVTGVFRLKETNASIEEEEFWADSGAFMDALKARPPPSGQQAKTIFDLSNKEQNAGLLSKWVTSEYLDKKFGKGKWRALPRYAIDQNGKWRLIDNGKAGQHNGTYEAYETIHTTCTSAGVCSARRFRRLIGKALKKNNSLTISIQDMWKAYAQIPCHPEQLRFMIVMVWHPDDKRWVYAESKGLLFGLTGAVLAFNRIPALMVALARRWLAIPVQNFFDDFRIMDIMGSGGSANKFFCIFVEEILGFRMDPAKEQKPDGQAIFLGNIEQYKVPYMADSMKIYSKPGRKKAINDFITEVLLAAKLTPGDAKTLRGRIIHYSSTCAGRVGKGILHFVNEQASMNSATWSEGLMFNLLFLQELLTLDIPRIISLAPIKPKQVRIWTDASFHTDASGTPICKLCGIISFDGGESKGIVLTVPPSLISVFNERKQQIHMGELLAPVCSVLHWGQLIKDASVIFYIDNMGILCNVVNGSARQLDAGTVTFALHLQLASLRSSVWWEWVESESNCSDGGSREGITCPIAKELGITLKEVDFPDIPAHFMRMTPLEWSKFWEEQ